uniref:Uncharacterized protein n=1 Tax=uncultured marine virus TaxID=186617 RepID=A0A0F7L9B0_9VIRU|nr:hypothetical protein Xp10p33 [uncultured marine virus]
MSTTYLWITYPPLFPSVKGLKLSTPPSPSVLFHHHRKCQNLLDVLHMSLPHQQT